MNIVFARLGTTLAAILFLGWSSLPAVAAAADGVARISVTSGSITLQHGDNGESEAALVNAPVSAGDYLSTASGARTEVQLDNATFVRVAADAQMRFEKLDPNDRVLQLAAGTADVRVLAPSDSKVELDTPSISIVPDEPGSYRATVDADGNTIFTVRRGSADVLGPNTSRTIESGTTVEISGSSSSPRISTIETVAYDDFDSWNAERDSYEQAAVSSSYVNSGVVGTDDLDAYGHWVYVPDYGNAWVPYATAPDWAPYEDGRWAWTPYYGWTWVGYEPWGWAPYHYGRWFYAPIYGWAWWPGPVYQPVVYSPGLVAFFGFGGANFTVAFGFSNVAWVPLAPFEPYYPWYGPGFVNVANVTNITNITNITNVTNITNINNCHCYRNARGPHAAIAALTVRDFENGAGSHHYIPVRARDLQQVAVIGGALPFHPTKANLRFGAANVSAKPVTVSPRFHLIEARPQTAASRITGGTQAGSAKTQAGLTKTLAPAQAGSHVATFGAGRNPAWNRFAQSRGVQAADSGSLRDGSSRSAFASAVQTGAGAKRLSQVPHPAAHGTATAVTQGSLPDGAWSRFNAGRQEYVVPPNQTGTGAGAHPLSTRIYGSGVYGSGVYGSRVNGSSAHRSTSWQTGSNGRRTVQGQQPSSPWARFNGTYDDRATAWPSGFNRSAAYPGFENQPSYFRSGFPAGAYAPQGGFAGSSQPVRSNAGDSHQKQPHHKR